MCSTECFTDHGVCTNTHVQCTDFSSWRCFVQPACSIAHKGFWQIVAWCLQDAPEKYLRIGQPQSVGTYTEGDRATLSNNKSTAGQASTAFSNPRFPGIRDPQNGVSMLTQIGFGADFYRVDKFYTMFVGKRNKAQLAAAGVPSFVPTWDNVRRYYQQYIRDYIAQQNGTIGKPETFVIPSEVSGEAGADSSSASYTDNLNSRCSVMLALATQ